MPLASNKLANSAFTRLFIVLLIIFGILVTVFLVTASGVRIKHSHPEPVLYSQEEYRAWCTLERRSDIPYEDWRILVRTGWIRPTPAK